MPPNSEKRRNGKMEKGKTEMEMTEMENMTEQQGTEREDEAMDVAEYMKVKLSKPYKLDGKEVSEIDMGALEELTGADMLAIDRTMKRRGNTDASPEFTLEFAFFAAMQATGLPLEFFHGLSMKDSIKVKMRVNYFLMY